MDVVDVFSSSPAASEDVPFRGSTIALRALAGFETERLEAVYVRPRAPYRRQPGTNPESGPIMVDEQYPDYRRDLEKWVRKFRVLEIAAAMGMAHAGVVFEMRMPEAALKAWAEGVLTVCRLSDEEIAYLWNRLRDLADPYGAGGDRVEAAKKALSALSRPVAMATLKEMGFPLATE